LNETEFALMDKPLSSMIQLTQDPQAAKRVFSMPFDFEWSQTTPQDLGLYLKCLTFEKF
jgi:hypothetical protein